MKLLRANEHKQMKWKNGGGITREIARAPNNDTDEFDWRLSMAQVKPPGGPFSLFPGIDRTLCVISPNQLCLTINNNADQIIHLDQNSLPYSFAGELSITCQIYDETLTDLNVMTRRTKFQHSVERSKMESNEEKTVQTLTNNKEIMFIIVGQGQLKINDDIYMTHGDALQIDQHSLDIKIIATMDNTFLYIVRLHPIHLL